MPERRVGTVFAFPIIRRPTVMVEVADTGMICSDPIVTWKYDVKNLVHVGVDGNVGIEKYTGLVGGQLKSSELGPCILETARYEGGLPVLR